MNVLFPTSLAHACQMLAGAPAAIPIAGGTDLLVHWPTRTAEHDKTYLDLSKLVELKPITRDGSSITLGALTTYWDVIGDKQIASDFPLLVEAARQVGAVQIQSRGTWAGNIANGSPAADGVPALLALDALVNLTSAAGSRIVPLNSYYTGYRKSVKRPDELIASITIPRTPRDLSLFFKVGPRRAQAITKIGLAITRMAAEDLQPWRVVANSVAATVRRCPTVENMLTTGVPVSSPAGFLAAAKLDIAPIDDIRSTAQYRTSVFCRLLYHSLRGRIPSIT